MPNLIAAGKRYIKMPKTGPCPPFKGTKVIRTDGSHRSSSYVFVLVIIVTTGQLYHFQDTGRKLRIFLYGPLHGVIFLIL